MEQFRVQNLSLRVADNINYAWILLDEQTDREQFAASLGAADFRILLQRFAVRNILIDTSQMWSFGIPEMADYLDKNFTAEMRGAGVEKISVILNEDVISLLSFIFQTIETNHAAGVPQIRFYSTPQFYETGESVSWFE